MNELERAAIVTFLNQVVEFEAEEIEEFFEITQPVHFAKGEMIFQSNDLRGDCFFLLSGLARSYYLFDHKEVNTRLFAAPAFVLQLSSYVNQSPSGEHVQTVTACDGLLLKRQDFLAGKIRESRKQMILRRTAELHYVMMEQRLLMIQYKSAVERYAYFREVMDPAVIEQMPSFHIASYLGITPESYSRIKRQFAEDEAV